MDELYDFVLEVFSISGSCSFTCDICKKDYQSCDGEHADEKGNCPDDCNGIPDSISYAHDWQSRQVCLDCFEKVFGPYKRILDNRRPYILNYFAKEIKQEKEAILLEENILTNSQK